MVTVIKKGGILDKDDSDISVAGDFCVFTILYCCHNPASVYLSDNYSCNADSTMQFKRNTGWSCSYRYESEGEK